MPLNILFSDPFYVAIDKPSGLLVHRTAIARDRVFALQQLRDQLRQRVFPVHRIDRATSGVLVFGRSADAARRLATAFEQRRVDKRYLAVVRGWTEPYGLIDHPVADDDGNRVAQAATTLYRRLATLELPIAVPPYRSARYSLISVKPLTGRRQQIRRHLKHISHHLIGDTTHGNGPHNRLFREHLGLQRMLLQAQRLAFVHPFHGTPIAISAPPDADWLRVAALFEVTPSTLLRD
ncbi:MAG: pseudouridylate synthase [Gammaproteobacteria bacterium]|nr:pseudouridylate synthase [Gammaproteobacteria bacterium]